KVSEKSNYVFSLGASDTVLTANYIVREEMQVFEFTSSLTECAVTGIKDKSVTEIVLPEYVTTIAAGAFSECSGLTSVTIGKGVTSIGSYAFEDCSGLTNVTISDSVTSIGSSAFSGCSGLTSVTLPFVGSNKDGTDKTHFGYIFGAYSSISNSSSVPSSLKTVIITGGTSIGSYAFEDCSGLTSVTIPDSVTSIGSFAFDGCSGLTSVAIGNGVTSIGSRAFYNCSGLTSVTIPDSVTSIGSSAFYNCSGLTSVTIGNGVTIIASDAFEYCRGLTSITFTGTKEQWNKISKGDNWNSNTGAYKIYCTDGTISK
ncbi:MAG: leucine-rich repeat domain-containing protein, partial [Candidatus Borkfalkiaceae bacterium]|nr:leucine-rich repeat domain-containing protein [Christensenellaceae bacterium]